MSNSVPANDEKKVSASTASSVASFTIDGLLGLTRRDAKEKAPKDKSAAAGSVPDAKLTPGTATTHLVYSAAAASAMVPTLHGAIWPGHPAFRGK